MMKKGKGRLRRRGYIDQPTVNILFLAAKEYEILESQRQALNELYPDRKVIIHKDISPFADVQEIIDKIKEGDYDDVVAVAPLWLIYHLFHKGLRPLYPIMDKVTDKQLAELTIKDRLYKFNRFKRIERMEIFFKEISSQEPGELWRS